MHGRVHSPRIVSASIGVDVCMDFCLVSVDMVIAMCVDVDVDFLSIFS